MDLVSRNTYWTKISAIPFKYTYLSEDTQCNVAIIGGGITGALCAYYFTNAGINTVILDKNIIGYGSTSASTSILQYEIDNNLSGLKAYCGMNNAVKSFKLCEEAVYEIKRIVDRLEDKCGFAMKDCFYYTYREKDVEMLKKEYDLRKQYGFNVEYIDEDKAKNMFSFHIKGGIYSRGSSGEIDPYRFTHALIADSVKRGLRVFENTEIVDIKPEGSGVILKSRNGFCIKASRVIICAGFESKKYIDKRLLKLTRTFTIVSKPLSNFDGWYQRCIIRDTETNYTYIRSTSDNRIIIGGEDLDAGGERSKMSNLQNDYPAALQKYDILIRRLQTMFPNITGIEAEYCFSGLFGDTKDSLPYIGQYSSMPNCYFNLGYGSNGILYADFGARMLRDLFSGNPPPELNLFSLDR